MDSRLVALLALLSCFSSGDALAAKGTVGRFGRWSFRVFSGVFSPTTTTSPLFPYRPLGRTPRCAATLTRPRCGFLSLLPGACLLPADEGPCKAQKERYFYNTFTQKCEVFYYGGCQGNGNNFKSYLECQKSCFRIPSEFCRVLDEPFSRPFLPEPATLPLELGAGAGADGGSQGSGTQDLTPPLVPLSPPPLILVLVSLLLSPFRSPPGVPVPQG